MDAVNEYRWTLRAAQDPGAVESLSVDLAVPLILARLLAFRGISEPEAASCFLTDNLSALPDPFAMRGMFEAVARLMEAVDRGESVCIHGDYDVDGMTATALLAEGFSSLGVNVGYHIPLRLRDGYGLSAEALQQSAAEGFSVIVSVDCGVSAVEEARIARELGLDLIITDHHQVPPVLPEAFAVVNPHQLDCDFPYKELSGVGVAFFLLIAFRKALRERGWFATRTEPDLRQYLDLVALGTIADVVPLTGVNRILASKGLEVMKLGRRTGIEALRLVSGVDVITASAVGFRLAPRLNAAGRLEDASLVVQLLLEPDAQRARSMASELDSFNSERQRIEREVLAQARERVDTELPDSARSIVLADERWHPGVIGIVASRMVERYNRPCMLIALEGELGKGSGRSVQGFHLVEALRACSGFLQGFGGHAFAAGLSLSTNDLGSFSEAFEKQALSVLGTQAALPEIRHDGPLLSGDLSLSLLDDLSRLAPFGAGNPEPLFVLEAVRVFNIRVMGEKHLSFEIDGAKQRVRCIAFGKADWAQQLSGTVDLLGIPEINEWKGRQSLQLRIRDIRRNRP